MKKKEKILLTLLVSITVILITAITYSFFVLTVDNKNAQYASITTGSVSLIFADGTETFQETRLGIGQSATKTFVVTNNNKVEETVHMYFKDLINTHVIGGLTYTLEYSSSKEGNYIPVVSNLNIPVGDEEMLRLVASNLRIPANTTLYYKLTITYNHLEDKDQTSDKDAVLNTKFTITSGGTLANLASHIENLYTSNSTVTNNGITYNTDNVDKLIDDKNGNIRYYGANPNNYVKFEDGKIWRIIGLFETELQDGTKQKLVKLIGGTKTGIPYAGDSWSSIEINSNSWIDSTIRDVINDDTKYNSIIQKVNLHIGSMDSANIYTNQMLALEQAGPKVEGERKVLMYLSDYGYAADFNYCDKTIYGYSDASCTSNNWLYTPGLTQWTLNPVNGNGRYTEYEMLITANGAVFNNNAVHYGYGARTVMYLNADAPFSGGDGSEINPYKISDDTKKTSNESITDSYATLKALGLVGEVKTEPTNYNMFNYTWSGYSPANRQESIGETRGVYTIEDDFGTSYYFRGPKTLDNIVKFGKYETDMYRYQLSTGEYLVGSLEDCQAESSNVSTYCTDTYKYASAGDDMYWRIIRINGDGTLRLMYMGTDTIGDDGNIGISSFDIAGNVGYTYNNTSPDAGDGTASSVKKYLDKWYSSFMSTEDINIATAQFYSDTSLTKDNYSSLYRLNKYNSSLTVLTDEVKPQLKTNATTNTYGGRYNLKVGLINVDELVISGFDGVHGINNYDMDHIIYPYTSSTDSYSIHYMTMSPYDINSTNVFSTGSAGDIWHMNSGLVRPVINLTKEYARTLVWDAEGYYTAR